MSVLKSDWHAYIFFKVFVSNFRMPPTSKRGYHHLGDDDDDEEIKVTPIKKRTDDCCDQARARHSRVITNFP